MIRSWWKRLFGTSALTRPDPTPTEAAARKLKVSLMAVAAAGVVSVSPHGYAGLGPIEAFSLPKPAPGVINPDLKLDGVPILGMDSMQDLGGNFADIAFGGFVKEGLGFLGYPYLAELSQRAEYRRPVEIIAKEMTRKWIDFTVKSGDKTKAEQLKQLDTAFKAFRIKELFKKSAEGDGYMGRHQLFVDTGDRDDQRELLRPLVVDPRKLGKGFLKGFQSVEAIWSYPAAFQATDPLDEDFYKPQVWFVQAKGVHVSRLLTFVSRPMPDILKPAYAFGGLALTQMAKPYVDNWLSTRQSVNDLISAFSTMVLATDMDSVLQGDDGNDMLRRVDLMNRTRDNRGTFVIDKATEEFSNVSAPLGSLDKLQAQAQEHMSSVTGIPLVVLLGITPSGLNASSDGEMQAFYAWIKDLQEQLFRPNLERVLELVQLHLWGQIDPDIGFEFVPLWEDDAATVATIEKTKADTATAYINAGVIAPEEERERLANDEASMYEGVNLTTPAPEPPGDPAAEGDPLNDPEEDAQAQDAWTESDHDRDAAGRFGNAGSPAEHRAGAAWHHEKNMGLRKEANAAGPNGAGTDMRAAANEHAAFAQHHIVRAKIIERSGKESA